MAESPKKYLIVINDGPYGSERPYNALRLALNLLKRPGAAVRLFLVGDGVQCAIADQETRAGHYNVERMTNSVVQHGEVAT